MPPRKMAAQLDRIAAVSTLDNIQIGIIPISAEATWIALTPFTLYELDGDECVVLVDLDHACLTIETPGDLATYRAVLSSLRQAAVWGDAARQHLHATAATAWSPLILEYRRPESG